jgi:formylglycine-generating enzyme required for sulfatase activity
MALIPAGSFTMGDTLDGESDAIPTSVTVSAFYMDTNLVSYSQWQSVYNWATNHGYGFDNAGSGKAANHPVQTVDWYDVVKWCNARSQQAGLTPVYYTDAGLTQVYTNGGRCALCELGGQWLSVADGSGVGEGGAGRVERATVSVGRHDFRKPGQLLRRHPTIATIWDRTATTPFRYRGAPYTSPVGYFAANGYGLYDMAGMYLSGVGIGMGRRMRAGARIGWPDETG